MLVAALQWSDVCGAILILAGLYLVVTGAPDVERGSAGTLGLIGDIFKEYKRVGIGLVLIVIGAVLLGAEIPDGVI